MSAASVSSSDCERTLTNKIKGELALAGQYPSRLPVAGGGVVLSEDMGVSPCRGGPAN